MILAPCEFVARQVGRNLWRGRRHHLLSAAVMAASLFFFNAFTFVQVNLQDLLERLGDRLQITAYFNRQLGENDIAALVARLQSLPEVARAQLISQGQAWNDFQAALGSQSGLLEGLPRGVLPASVEITLRPAYRGASSVEQFVARLRGVPEFVSVEYPQAWVERLEWVLLAVEWVKWSLGGLLFLAIFFIVGGAAKLALAVHRQEIEVMQFLGASIESIQAPFVLAGVIQGLAGGALSIALLWALFICLKSEFALFAVLWAPLAEPQFLDSMNIAFVLALGCLLGAATSLFSLRPWLRTWKAVARGV